MGNGRTLHSNPLQFWNKMRDTGGVDTGVWDSIVIQGRDFQHNVLQTSQGEVPNPLW